MTREGREDGDLEDVGGPASQAIECTANMVFIFGRWNDARLACSGNPDLWLTTVLCFPPSPTPQGATGVRSHGANGRRVSQGWLGLVRLAVRLVVLVVRWVRSCA